MEIPKEILLQYYSRKDVQEELLIISSNREVAVSFGGKGYGKRPDTLNFPADVLEAVKQGATSFHISEERWSNVLELNSNMSNKEKDNLRDGWDLVIDIDAPNWKISKLITWLIFESLKNHGIKNISVKFSGNKGFHIGVPFESFPRQVNKKETGKIFPEHARIIAEYLLNYIDNEMIHVKNNDIIFNNKYKISLKNISKMTGKSVDEITKKICPDCKKEIKPEKAKKEIQHSCPNCSGAMVEDFDEIYKCKKCGFFEKYKSKQSACLCGTKSSPTTRFNSFSVVEVDTILISSRHLYRAPLSINEKSGLVSVPINPEKILVFSKESAKMENAKTRPEFRFLDETKSGPNEAKVLFDKAQEFNSKKIEKQENEKADQIFKSEKKDIQYDLEEQQVAISKDYFPPCIERVFEGMKDGKKRCLFILINFLTCVGWSKDQITQKINEWNQNNAKVDEMLKEVYVNGQLRHSFALNKKILPPNCDNKQYYKDIQICLPDNLCSRIKNPVQYTRLKLKIETSAKPKKRAKKEKTPDDKEISKNI